LVLNLGELDSLKVDLLYGKLSAHLEALNTAKRLAPSALLHTGA
jgi:hypothetical protein